MKVLRTRWKFQKHTFPDPNDHLRWGFKVLGTEGPDQAFFKGVTELVGNGMVVLGGDGLAYLTDVSLDYCVKLAPLLEAGGPYWCDFAPNR